MNRLRLRRSGRRSTIHLAEALAFVSREVALDEEEVDLESDLESDLVALDFAVDFAVAFCVAFEVDLVWVSCSSSLLVFGVQPGCNIQTST